MICDLACIYIHLLNPRFPSEHGAHHTDGGARARARGDKGVDAGKQLGLLGFEFMCRAYGSMLCLKKLESSAGLFAV